MIKRCPTCNRTYSDESISFCLDDGALLSAPIELKREEPPPTEILPSRQREMPPTQPAQSATPTITTLGGAPKYSRLPASGPKQTQSRAPLWIALAILLGGALVIGGLALRFAMRRESEVVAAANPQSSPVESSSPFGNAATPTANFNQMPTARPTAGPSQPRGVSSAQPTPKMSPTPVAADPVLFPPDTRSLPYGDPKSKSTPAATAATDYNRIFGRSEVDSQARILEKPEPQYTESARKNQVNGVVVLRAVFSSSGSVTNISVVRGLPDGLSERAIAAARQIRFVPAMKDGRPISMWVQLEYNFNQY